MRLFRPSALAAATVLSALIYISATVADSKISFWGDNNRYILVPSKALYPEGIERHPGTGEFLLGSVRQGKVIAVSHDGAVRTLIEDERLRSVVGIRVDAARGRLLVNNSDYGVAERSAPSDEWRLILTVNSSDLADISFYT